LRTFGHGNIFRCLGHFCCLGLFMHFFAIAFFRHLVFFRGSTNFASRDISHFGVTHSRDLLRTLMGPLSWQLGPIHNIIIWDMILCIFCVSGRGRQQGTARKSSLVSPSTISYGCQRIELALLIDQGFSPLWHFGNKVSQLGSLILNTFETFGHLGVLGSDNC
jgi:hypothetical protein